jgi:hypothetical protein
VAAIIPWFGSPELVSTVVFAFDVTYEGEEAEKKRP